MEILKAAIDSFGSAIVVPVILYIIARVLKVSRGEAFRSALSAGVSLEGFILIIGAYTPIVTPLIEDMSAFLSDYTGVSLDTFDVGWQATSVVAYATSAGMIFLGLGIALQTVLFFLKWTNVFQPADLWNNYSYIVWGAMVIYATGNYLLGIGLMILLNLYSLLISELIAKRWSAYYRFPNCTIVSMHNVEPAVFAILIDPIYNLLGLHKKRVHRKRRWHHPALLGEPMTLGFLIGMGIGLLGSVRQLDTLQGWGTACECAIATAAIMAIFPKVASMFAQAFVPITEAAKSHVKGEDREWFIAINDAVGFGEPRNLETGLILIPVMILLAILLPGNRVLPVVDLLALPYMIEGLTAVYHGNRLKIFLTAVIWFGLGLWMCSFTAPLFTRVAVAAGFSISAGMIYITSFNILGKPLMGLIFLAFLSQNPVWIALTVVIYLLLAILYKKYKLQITQYLEDQAEKNRESDTVRDE